MIKLIANKTHLKGLFESLMYFMFLASLLKLTISNTSPEAFYERLTIVIAFLLLSTLVVLYSLIHVLGPIVKVYHPDFKVPFVDAKSPTGIPMKEFFSKKGATLWLFLGVPYYLIGIYIAGLGFN
ncbi:hypothetical protein [Pseudoalteromonas luteoviolacea]|uniref:hypothetical protein n=1 Tax=Pseudoalteromonas luteoviolacea TaxID=43657 RepID=UPI0011546EA6|nr:hypothetical protein [Pseudoalteromonas luteoviolacea]TQF70461.1 hypothetical protein FLM44_05035 [Pseudoalteromonas luteoviolacea]